MSAWREVRVKFKRDVEERWGNIKKGEIKRGFSSLNPPDSISRVWVEIENGIDPAKTDLKNHYPKLYDYLAKNNIKVHSFTRNEVDVIDVKVNIKDEYKLEELRYEI